MRGEDGVGGFGREGLLRGRAGRRLGRGESRLLRTRGGGRRCPGENGRGLGGVSKEEGGGAERGKEGSSSPSSPRGRGRARPVFEIALDRIRLGPEEVDQPLREG